MILASSILVYFSSFFFITFELLRWVNYISPPKISNCPRFVQEAEVYIQLSRMVSHQRDLYWYFADIPRLVRLYFMTNNHIISINMYPTCPSSFQTLIQVLFMPIQSGQQDKLSLKKCKHEAYPSFLIFMLHYLQEFHILLTRIIMSLILFSLTPPPGPYKFNQ